MYAVDQLCFLMPSRRCISITQGKRTKQSSPLPVYGDSIKSTNIDALFVMYFLDKEGRIICKYCNRNCRGPRWTAPPCKWSNILWRAEALWKWLQVLSEASFFATHVWCPPISSACAYLGSVLSKASSRFLKCPCLRRRL